MKWLILLCLLSTPAYAWTEADTQRQLVYSAFHVIDWGQTRDIATRDDHIETNPILGKYPSVQTVDYYFAAAIAGHTLVSYLLPPKYRKWWQVIWIGLEAKTVAHNYSAGVNIHF